MVNFKFSKRLKLHKKMNKLPTAARTDIPLIQFGRPQSGHKGHILKRLKLFGVDIIPAVLVHPLPDQL